MSAPPASTSAIDSPVPCKHQAGLLGGRVACRDDRRAGRIVDRADVDGHVGRSALRTTRTRVARVVHAQRERVAARRGVGVDQVARARSKVARQQIVDLRKRAGQGHGVAARATHHYTCGTRVDRERARDHRQGGRDAGAARIHVANRQARAVQHQAHLLAGAVAARRDAHSGRVVDRTDADGGAVRGALRTTGTAVAAIVDAQGERIARRRGIPADEIAHRGAQVAGQQIVDLGQRPGEGNAVAARAGHQSTAATRAHCQRARDHREGGCDAGTARIRIRDRQPRTVQRQPHLLGGGIARRDDRRAGCVVDRSDDDGGPGRGALHTAGPGVASIVHAQRERVARRRGIGVDQVARGGAQVARQQVVDLGQRPGQGHAVGA